MRKLTRKQRRAIFERVCGEGAYAQRLQQLRAWAKKGNTLSLMAYVAATRGCALYTFWFHVYHGDLPTKQRARLFQDMSRRFSKRASHRERELRSRVTRVVLRPVAGSDDLFALATLTESASAPIPTA